MYHEQYDRGGDMVNAYIAVDKNGKKMFRFFSSSGELDLQTFVTTGNLPIDQKNTASYEILER